MLDNKYTIALIAIFVSLVVSLISLVITKENKTSEFRQQWINEIREEISNYLSLLYQYKIAWIIFKETSEDNNFVVFFKENIEKIKEINKYKETIVFRLNDDDKDDKKLIQLIKEINDILEEKETIDNDELFKNYHENIVKKSKNLLKLEWERVKKGEPYFKGVKIVFSIVLIVLLGFISYNIWDNENKQNNIKIEKKFIINNTLKKYSFYFKKSQIEISEINNKEYKELVNFFNSYKEFNNDLYITIIGYSSKEKLINHNEKFSSNYELSLARAKSLKKEIENIVIDLNINPKRLHFNVYAYSNEYAKVENHNLERKVLVKIDEISEIKSFIK